MSRVFSGNAAEATTTLEPLWGLDEQALRAPVAARATARVVPTTRVVEPEVRIDPLRADRHDEPSNPCRQRQAYHKAASRPVRDRSWLRPARSGSRRWGDGFGHVHYRGVGYPSMKGFRRCGGH